MTALADALLLALLLVFPTEDATRLVPDTGRPDDVVTGSACAGRGDATAAGVDVPLVDAVPNDWSRPSLNR